MSQAAIERALRHLADEGINVTMVERNGVLYANVHETPRDEAYTWIRVVREFLAVSYCVQVR